MSSSSSMGSALSYNEEKVKEGEAEVIAEVNVDSDHLSIRDTFARLETMNIRSKDVSFHMSINPAEGERLTREQVKELVSDIMKGLGYGSQPYVIYRHDDIGRTHYHVVSIRTDRRGRKIPDRQEKRNCVRILEGLSEKYGFNGNVEIVNDASIRGITSSYPGTPLRVGSSGPNVVVVQVELNRISQNYPAIPKVPSVDGIFGSRTEASVRAFQRIFGLTADGIVGKATWYALVRLYTAVTSLSELRSQGQQFYAISWAYPGNLQQGDSGQKVRHLQYMLSVVSEFIPQIPPVTADGIYGPNTRDAVIAAQRWFGIPQTGITDNVTWDRIYDQFSGIETETLRNTTLFPNSSQNRAVTAGAFSNNSSARTQNRNNYSQTTNLTQFPGRDLQIGNQDPVRQEVVR